MSVNMAPNFSLFEVACKCGCALPAAVAANAAMLSWGLQEIRDQWGPVHITSWYRCPEHNKSVGGAPKSYHLTGLAADIKVPGCPDLAKVAARVFAHGGVGTYSKYPDMVHVDLRGFKARWSK